MSLDERPDVQVACVTPEGVTTVDNGDHHSVKSLSGDSSKISSP